VEHAVTGKEAAQENAQEEASQDAEEDTLAASAAREVGPRGDAVEDRFVYV
jgi:hypothetical protein